jgi:hypothetical protein
MASLFAKTTALRLALDGLFALHPAHTINRIAIAMAMAPTSLRSQASRFGLSLYRRENRLVQPWILDFSTISQISTCSCMNTTLTSRIRISGTGRFSF